MCRTTLLDIARKNGPGQLSQGMANQYQLTVGNKP